MTPAYPPLARGCRVPGRLALPALPALPVLLVLLLGACGTDDAAEAVEAVLSKRGRVLVQVGLERRSIAQSVVHRPAHAAIVVRPLPEQ